MGVGLINLYQATPVGGVYLQNAGLMWVLPLAVAVFGAVFFMNNLTSAKSSFKDQVAIIGRKHTWIMAFIYVGTFGSFIGYSAAFPLLIKTQFPAVTIAIAFLGPLVGSLSRPLGGLLADKIGGAIITFWNFIAMGAATIGVLYFVGTKDFTGFLVMFLILFVTTGIGNGSTYRMIPSIFREENLRKAKGKGEAGRALALKTASIQSGAAVGFIGAIGACGGYLIPSGFGKSIAITGGPQLALEIYLAFYAVCLAMTWWYYLRRQLRCNRAPPASPRRASERSMTHLPRPAQRARTRETDQQERNMTPDQVKLVQQSFAKVAPISETAAVLFYDRLFEIAPAGEGDVSGRYDRAAQEADGDAGRRGQRSRQSRIRSCRPRARSPSAMSAMAPRPSTIPWSARRCCGPWKRASAMPGRLKPPLHGPRPMATLVRLHDFRGLWPSAGRRVRIRRERTAGHRRQWNGGRASGRRT